MPSINLNIGPNGALLDILIDISQARKDFLATAGLVLPQPVKVTALIDTGASCTCITPSVIHSLGIPPIGKGAVSTPLTGTSHQLCSKYEVSVLLIHPEINFQIGAIPILETKVFGSGINALIGRDVLSKCLLIYNGLTNQYTISF